MFFKSKNKTEENSTFKEAYSSEDLTKMKLSFSLDKNIEMIRKIVGDNADLVSRCFTLGRTDVIRAAIFYFDNMVNRELIDTNVMQPLMTDSYASGLKSGTQIVSEIHSGNLITCTELKSGKTMKELTDGIVEGNLILLIEGTLETYIINVKGYDYRNIEESKVEPTVKGSRDAFIETLSVNIALIRRRIGSPNLVFERVNIGKVTQTKVCIGYIKGICPSKLINEIKLRLSRINIDGILGTNSIEEFIDDEPLSLFPQVRNTERPDTASGSLLEGRAVIIADGTPIVLVIPGEFFSLLQSAEDYYNRHIFSTLIRFLRYTALAISLILPSFYISIVNFHQELIPTRLLVSIISARAGVPLPNFAEAFLMEGTFEILREAGVRLPRPAGQAISIVGGLVIGQAAVQASVVSPLMVIIVSLTAIAAFTIPQYNISLSIRILRFFLMILSSILGLYGLMLGLLFILIHLCSIRSFGTPYLTPIAPFKANDLKDTLIRAPWWMFTKRPTETSYNKTRISPKPPQDGGNNP